MKLSLNKGLSAIDIRIADEKVHDVLSGSDVPRLPHSNIARIIEAGILDHSPKGVADKKIAVIIPDDTRAWARADIFVPGIVKALIRLGVSKQNITIIIAIGTHADMSPLSFAGLAGDWCAKNIRILNSANRDKKRLSHIGTTSRGTDVTITTEAADCEHIIIFGGVLHHMAAGYGGGRKYILPGIAGFDSIQQNHSLMIQKNGRAHPMVQQGILKGNPVSDDMDEAAQMFLKDKTCTYVAVAANGSGDIFHARVGDLESTFINSCKKLDRACCVKVQSKADFAVISTGGHHTDTQLYQSTKALFNTVNVVTEDAKILFIAGCAQGVGNEVFARVLSEYKDHPEKIGQQLGQNFNMPAYVAFRVIDILHRFNVTLISDLPEKTTKDLGFNFTGNLDNYIKTLSGKGLIIPFAENILPVIAD